MIFYGGITKSEHVKNLYAITNDYECKNIILTKTALSLTALLSIKVAALKVALTNHCSYTLQLICTLHWRQTLNNGKTAFNPYDAEDPGKPFSSGPSTSLGKWDFYSWTHVVVALSTADIAACAVNREVRHSQTARLAPWIKSKRSLTLTHTH